MTLARHQGVAQDATGNTLASPTIKVQGETDGAPLVQLYSDRAGATAIGNPFTGNADGTFEFHVVGGAYKITVTKGAEERIKRYVAIGTAAEYDVNDALTPGHRWTFDDETGDADPGTGLLRANNATFASITEIYIDDEDNAGNNVEDWLDALDDHGKSANRGTLWLQDPTDVTVFMELIVTGSVVDGTGYRKLTVTPVSGDVPANATELAGTFLPRGADGSGAWEFVGSVAGAGGTIDFTDIDNTYIAYKFVLDGIDLSTDAVLEILTDGNNGASFDVGASDYEWGYFRSNVTHLVAQDDADAQIVLGDDFGGGANELQNGIVYLYNPAASAQTTLSWHLAFVTTSGQVQIAIGGGRRSSAAAVNAIRFQASTGNIAAGTIHLFGLRAS
jgi:hypothetical protein